jgi:hypothetical protein
LEEKGKAFSLFFFLVRLLVTKLLLVILSFWETTFSPLFLKGFCFGGAQRLLGLP